MAKVVNTILNLKDNMSGGIVKTSQKMKGMSKEARRASQQVAYMANDFKKKVGEMAAKAAKLAAAGAGIAGAFALKTGLSEAIDLEGFRTQLETATKDTKKAADIMKYSIDLANKTPFEGGQLVEGAAKFEAMGMSAKKWLPLVGDMAAATNKDFDQAVEALIDAQTGELERLKEFGITKAMIADKANKMFVGQEVINNKGQIVNQEKFNEAMVALMQDKYTGGMEKQSKTLKGVWSTITGIMKSSLAKMVGMGEDGTIKAGSLLDTIKKKAIELSEKFQQWQADGTIQRLADGFSEAFGKICKAVKSAAGFIVKHKEMFKFIGVAFAGIATGIQVAKALKIAMTGLQIAWALFNGTLALSPLGWVVTAITGVVAAGYLLWKNWDSLKAKAAELWENLKATFSPVGEFFGGVWNTAADGFKGFLNFFVKGINKVVDSLNGLSFTVPDWVPELGGKTFGFEIPNVPELALGTNYAKGGPTRINERGGEIVDLPNGSRVIPADKSKSMIGKDLNVNVIVQGNMIGNKEYADYLGGVIWSKIKPALDNM